MDPNFSMIQPGETRPGDYIVGKYSEMGKEIKAGRLEGNEDEINAMKEMLSEHAGRSGGRSLITKSTVTKKAPAKKTATKKGPVPNATVYEEPDEPAPFYANIEQPKQSFNQNNRKKYIYLYNKLGKIKLSIESLIECEQAYCVVFYNEDDLIFVPNPAETLTMVTPDGDEVLVYYANTLFTWTDHVKQLLVLFKVNE